MGRVIVGRVIVGRVNGYREGVVRGLVRMLVRGMRWTVEWWGVVGSGIGNTNREW